jgi:hypothetical protein
MTIIQANIIKSLTKVIDIAQSGYDPRGLPNQMNHGGQALTLTVVSVKNNHTLLQDQSSGKTLLVENSALQRATNNNLTKGDSLILVSVDQKVSTFIVEKSHRQYTRKLIGNALKDVLSALNIQWPDLPLSMLRKSRPVILNQLQIASNTQQAANLSKAVVAIASNTGQPTISVKTSASAMFIKAPIQSEHTAAALNPVLVDKSIADVLRLAIDTNSSRRLFIDLPLNNRAAHLQTAKNLSPIVITELKSIMASGEKINIQFDVNSRSKLITSMTRQDLPTKQLSPQTLKEINQVISPQITHIKQTLSTFILAPHSPNLQKGIVLTPSLQTLQELGTAAKQTLSQNVSPAVLQHASILVGQNQQNTNQIQLSLIAKPITVSIDNSQLSAINRPRGLVGANVETKTGIGSLSINRSNVSGEPAAVSDVIGKPDTVCNVKQSPAVLSRISSTPSLLRGTSTTPFVLSRVSSTPSGLSIINSPPMAEGKVSSGPIIVANENHTNNMPKPSQLLKAKLLDFLVLKDPAPKEIETKLAQLQSNIYKELNQALPKAQSMTQSLPRILDQLHTVGKDASSDLKQLIKQVSQQIKMYLPLNEPSKSDIPLAFSDDIDEIAASPSPRQIKQILTETALPNVTSVPRHALHAMNSQSGLVNGLVSMLQASLQAKLIAQQPQLLPALLQSLPFANALPAANDKTKASTNQTKILQDLGKLDPRGNIIDELNKVLSSHSLHKLSSAEASLQNQDSFYYVLPNMFSSQHKDIELIIKREREFAGENEKASQQKWQLTMKLDIGDNGDVLAKVKLANNNLELNLYASNQCLKEKILNYLPYLYKRLSSLGLQVKPNCFLGKIPSTLHKTDYQVVQAYV